MKIYHTETQADYSALMVELEMRGIEPLTNRLWKIHENQTVVFVRAIGRYGDSTRTDTTYGDMQWALYRYPDTPIQKYKAKAEEKMQFTKENVMQKMEEWLDEPQTTQKELRDRINELDDTPKKVVVPKCFDDWYREIKGYWKRDSSAKQFALWKLCQQGFGRSFEDVRGRKISYDSDLARWLIKNEMLAIDAILNGYTIEPEQLYYIPLPHLKTTDGIQQVLSKRSKNGRHYFASRPNDKLKQRYTQAELEQAPEVYKPFAKPIEEEEE